MRSLFQSQIQIMQTNYLPSILSSSFFKYHPTFFSPSSLSQEHKFVRKNLSCSPSPSPTTNSLFYLSLSSHNPLTLKLINFIISSNYDLYFIFVLSLISEIEQVSRMSEHNIEFVPLIMKMFIVPFEEILLANKVANLRQKFSSFSG